MSAAGTGTRSGSAPARRPSVPGGAGAPRRGAAGGRGTSAVGGPARAVVWLRGWLARPLTSFHLVLAVFALLTGLGLVMVLSASSAESASVGSAFSLFHRQLGFVGIGAVLFVVALHVPVRVVRALALPAMVVSLLALVLVLVPGVGVENNGTRGWFEFAGVGFQPAEAAKIAMAVWGSSLLATRRTHMTGLRHLFLPLLPVAAAMAGLILLQPDLGSTVTLAIIVGALLWFGGVSVRLFLAMSAAAVVGAVLFALTVGTRNARIESWLHPDAKLDTIGYQALQSRYSLADGGLFGVGLGQSRAKWDYLPNAHNDFIFAIVGEELGFVGGALVLVLFGILAWVGLRISARSLDPFLVLLSATTTVWLVGQAFLNVGYVSGLLPVTGLQLPMISSGGTSTALTMFMFGLLASAARHEPQAVAVLRNGHPGRLVRLFRLPVPRPYVPRGRRRGPRPPGPPARRGPHTAPASTGADRRPSQRTPSQRTPLQRTPPQRTSPQRTPSRGEPRGLGTRPVAEAVVPRPRRPGGRAGARP